MQHYPIFAHLHQRPVLLIGAGEVAERKADSLLTAGAVLRVVAKRLSPTFEAWRAAGRIHWLGSTFEPSQLDGVFLVVSATGDAALDAQVFRSAEAAGKLCNTVDNQAKCSYIVPAVVDRSPVQIAISSAGTSPVLARYWRRKIEAMMPAHTGKLAEIAGRWRQRVQARLHTMRARRHFWERLFESRFEQLVAQQQYEAAEAELAAQLAGRQPEQGNLSIVTTAADEADLLSLRALQLLQAADTVHVDDLVSDDVRQQIRKDASRHRLGDTLPGQPNGAEEGITHPPAPCAVTRLLEAARTGQRVVVLATQAKPSRLGLLHALIDAAREAGIPCQWVRAAAPLPQPSRQVYAAPTVVISPIRPLGYPTPAPIHRHGTMIG
ncbi:MAG: NAD(P)-dependent oxidoreductase [Lautropia sp.]|nr:NAD(P)-dependent oxidoreductase [Lautropia sp.]